MPNPGWQQTTVQRGSPMIHPVPLVDHRGCIAAFALVHVGP